MPQGRFNWSARPAPPNEGRFALGETFRVSDTILVKGECTQGCTLEVLLEHQSKPSQLQLVCNATALELKVALKMAPEYKWLVQIRGTPLPNEPDLYYYRTPEELSTSKVWRLRVKFLFSKPDVTAVRLHSLSLSFDKLTKRGSSSNLGSSASLLLPMGVTSAARQPPVARSSSMDSAGGGRGSSSVTSDDDDYSTGSSSILMSGGRRGMMAPSPSVKVPSSSSSRIIKGDEGKSEGSSSTSTTASLSTSPTGSSTPTSGAEEEDGMGSVASSLTGMSLHSSSYDSYSHSGSKLGKMGGSGSKQHPLQQHQHHSGASLSRKSSSSSLASAASSSMSFRRKSTGSKSAYSSSSSSGGSSGSQDEVIENLVSVIDSVVSAFMAPGGGSIADQLLVQELRQLKARVIDRDSYYDKTDEEIDNEVASDITRITTILATMMGATAAAAQGGGASTTATAEAGEALRR